MTDYNPTAYLVRLTSKKDRTGLTMDTSRSAVFQEIIGALVTCTARIVMKEYALKASFINDAIGEILTGATMNQIDRRESLLNEARNLLIDVEPICRSNLTERIAALIDEIGEEVRF